MCISSLKYNKELSINALTSGISSPTDRLLVIYLEVFPLSFSMIQDVWGVNALESWTVFYFLTLACYCTPTFQGNLPKNIQKTWLKFSWLLFFLSQSGNVWENKNKQKMWRKSTKVRTKWFPEHGSEDWSMLCFSVCIIKRQTVFSYLAN